MIIVFSNDEIFTVAKKLGVDFSKFSFDDLKRGIMIETEHGLVSPITNVTNNDLETTMKIALAHLNEFPNYYNKTYGLGSFEEFLRKMLKENV